MDARANELELKPGDIGSCPDWISPEGQEEWQRLTGDAQYSQVLAPVMRSLLIDYCSLYGRLIRWERGLVRWLDGGAAVAERLPDGCLGDPPLEHFTVTERSLLHTIRMQLGLTPASQSKVIAPKATAAPQNKFANF